MPAGQNKLWMLKTVFIQRTQTCDFAFDVFASGREPPSEEPLIVHCYWTLRNLAVVGAAKQPQLDSKNTAYNLLVQSPRVAKMYGRRYDGLNEETSCGVFLVRFCE